MADLSRVCRFPFGAGVYAGRGGLIPELQCAQQNIKVKYNKRRHTFTVVINGLMQLCLYLSGCVHVFGGGH